MIEQRRPKYRIYIDEVGNNDLSFSDDFNHRFLSLTGIIFNIEYMKNKAAPIIEKLKYSFFPTHHPDEPIILHRKEIINFKHPFHILKNDEIRNKFNNILLKIIDKLEYSIISVIIDKKAHNEKYKVWKYDPYHYCMEVIIERHIFFLERENSYGDILVESRGGKEDIRLKKSFSKIYQNGSQFLTKEIIQNRLTSKELKVKPKSSNIIGLQIADLLAYPSRDFMLQKYYNLEKKPEIFSNKINGIIKNKYYKGKNGKLEGYGIKLLP